MQLQTKLTVANTIIKLYIQLNVNPANKSPRSLVTAIVILNLEDSFVRLTKNSNAIIASIKYTVKRNAGVNFSNVNSSMHILNKIDVQ